MRSVIFFAVDNVLNCHTTRETVGGYRGIEKQKVALLKKLVDAMDAQLVLTSSWRGNLTKACKGGPDQIGRYLIKKLEEYGLKIFETTPDFGRLLRAKEVRNWIVTRKNIPVDRFVILDDTDYNWERYGLADYWFCTQDPDSRYDGPGLTEESVDWIIEHLEDYEV